MYDQVSAEILPSAQVTELDLNKDRYVLKTSKITSDLEKCASRQP
jgi:hypothetical protein